MKSRAGAVLGSLAFLVIAPGTFAAGVPYWITRWRPQPPLLGLPGERIAGFLLVGAGALAVLDSFARFALQGRGTPSPVAPTESLVVSGLYRYVRNPMYVAVLCIVLGQALFFGSLALVRYAFVAWCVVHLFVLLYEEPTLARQFGSSYEAYRANVRRWWPRRRPWSGQG